MPEAMPLPNFEEEKNNKEPDLDEKFLMRITQLEDEWKTLQKKIEEMPNGTEKDILIINRQNLEKSMREYRKSYNRYTKNKKLNSLQEKIGKKNVAEVIDFQKEKRKRKERKEIDPKTKKLIGEKFLDDYKNFRKKRI